MRKTIQQFIYLILITAFIGSASLVQAQRAYRVSDRQVQYLLNRIEQRTDIFKRTLNTALDRSTLNDTDQEDAVMNYVTEFENSTDALKQNFDARNSVAADVEDVLNRAAFINAFMAQNRLTPAAQSQWNAVKADLNTLSSYYNVRWAWSTRMPTATTTRTTARTTTSPYRVNDNAVQTLLARIETRTDSYKRALNNALDRSRIDDSNLEDSLMDYITEFENSTDRLKQRFDARESVDTDVQDVLSRAVFIDRFMRDNSLSVNSERLWNNLKADLNTLATYYNVSWDWNNTIQTPNNRNTGTIYNVSDRQLQNLLQNIEQRTDIFRRDMISALDRSVLDNTRSEDAVLNYITEFENATDRLRQNFDARRSTTADVEEVLNRAYFINSFMRDYRFAPTAERTWEMIRNDLNTLSNNYSVAWNWENRQYVPPTRFDQMLTGTYRLNERESDTVRSVVDRAIGTNYPVNQRERLRTNLERRLQSPEMLALQKTSSQVTIASTTSPQITFDVDGRARTEQTQNGRTINIKANTYYDGVAISYEGDRMNDFYVNFMPVNNGRQLRVVRRVYLENSNDTITVASVYDKVEEQANWSMVNRRDNNAGNTGTTGDFVIPNGTQMTAILTTPLMTGTTQVGDRFRMEVRSPSQYDGAIIEGRVIESANSGRVTGRANIALDFESITLRNGQRYTFAGLIESVKTVDGDDVSVNNEGTVRDSNQTTKTVTRAGIGAALGALIGAIAGGGEGAAIGAAIGAGVGGGSVLVTGRDKIELQQGTEFTITATAPSNVSNRRFNFNQ